MAAIIFKPEDNQYDYHMYLSALVSLNCFHLRKFELFYKPDGTVDLWDEDAYDPFLDEPPYAGARKLLEDAEIYDVGR
ncbi:hypothetical protein AK812_SmicGene48837 [Symbiodinium microadriaticum]|uniref:Uncharacterized protein n=1 Tax=Symbiodinium microadriaticum TaxID=2951 RepID=A0A1Q8ZK93_SYMMI|nr:hypothetical protein AK812_SmicGene48837 [Symbiodinium microadriaticum]CAE7212005.1 unnamed protein product [Symbiodinium microadriaticum]CAE7219249.1 unnamed protein product [Symbiodinium sp. KB8]